LPEIYDSAGDKKGPGQKVLGEMYQIIVDTHGLTPVALKTKT